jgi:hypothetical protein
MIQRLVPIAANTHSSIINQNASATLDISRILATLSVNRVKAALSVRIALLTVPAVRSYQS